MFEFVTEHLYAPNRRFYFIFWCCFPQHIECIAAQNGTFHCNQSCGTSFSIHGGWNNTILFKNTCKVFWEAEWNLFFQNRNWALVVNFIGQVVGGVVILRSETRAQFDWYVRRMSPIMPFRVKVFNQQKREISPTWVNCWFCFDLYVPIDD